MNGWIKIHRSILDWEWYGDINTKLLFLHLLLKANHKDKKWQGMTIKRGQILTGRLALSLETGLSERMVRTSLDKLKSTNEIAIETTNKNSVITILNYDSYQDLDSDDQHIDQQATNKRPTDDQQTTTTKECKNNKECKEENNIPPISPRGGSADVVDSLKISEDEITVEAIDEKRKKVAPKKEKPEPPAIEEFVAYGLANITGVTSYRLDLWENVLRLKYRAWMEAGWKTGGNKPKDIQIWKTTLLHTLPYLERVVSMQIQNQPTTSKLEHNLTVGSRVWGIN